MGQSNLLVIAVVGPPGPFLVSPTCLRALDAHLPRKRVGLSTQRVWYSQAEQLHIIQTH